MKELTKEKIKEFILQYGIKRRSEIVSFIMGYKSCLTVNEWDIILELYQESFLDE